MQSAILEKLNLEQDLTQWPKFGNTEFTDDGVALELLVSPDLAYFDGHFPEQSVLPGVVQVHWAGELARRLFSCSGFSGLIKIKFNGVVLPNTRITLNLIFREDLNRVDFEYADEKQKLSSGAISFQGST
jgi:3-hydroxymyristoyl/3-hydroxydecanoyl-(acyl carrier protein) dehydratase